MSLLMCADHWFKCSQDTRRGVTGALQAWQDGTGPIADLRAWQVKAVAEARR